MLPIAILAGGLGTRLRPITETIPKALVEVRGEPFVAHQLRFLKENGLERVVICAGHLGEMIEEFVGDGRRFGLSVRYSQDGPVLRGTAGALLHAASLLGDSFLVIYGDSYLPCQYRLVERAFLESGKEGLMTVFRNEGRFDRSNVEFASGKIIAYDKADRTPAMLHIDYGLGAFHARSLERIRGRQFYDLATFYEDLLRERQLAGFEVTERFYEVGSIEGIRALTEYLRDKYHSQEAP